MSCRWLGSTLLANFGPIVRSASGKTGITKIARIGYLKGGSARPAGTPDDANSQGWDHAEGLARFVLAPCAARGLSVEQRLGLAARRLPDAANGGGQAEPIGLRGEAHGSGHTRTCSAGDAHPCRTRRAG